jgi:DAACS family dicarboxylate/amino acid:cation (Na+ or H+) symporter
VVEAAAGGKILPIIFFAVTFGIALGNIGEKAQVVIAFFDAVFQALFKLTAGIIAFAPIGVAGVMAWVLATQGLNVLFGLAKMVGVLYLGLAIMLGIFWVFLQFFTTINPQQMFKKILEPFLLAFVTTSSEVTLPVHMKILEENGVPNRIASFVLPLGYTFNLDGSTLYQALAFSFLTEAYGIEMSLATKGAIFVTILIASKGTASVPAASLVVLATVLTSLGMPLDGIAVLIGVDRFMDMGRTGFNVIGNSVAAIMVAKWEGVLGKTEEELLAMEEQQLIAKQQQMQA